MPNIKQERRKALTEQSDLPQTEGELNYVFTLMCHDYLKRKGLNYANINAVVGALECCKMEIYRRIMAM